MGQYVTQDPIGLLGGINTKQYAWAAPVNEIDPKGLFVPLLAGAAVAGLAAYGAWSALKGMFTGSKDLVEGAKNATEGAKNKHDSLAFLGAQASRGYQACPRSGEELQKQYNHGVNQVQQGVGQIAKGAGDLSTSVPGTTATGPVPGSAVDLAAGGAVTIISNIK